MLWWWSVACAASSSLDFLLLSHDYEYTLCTYVLIWWVQISTAEDKYGVDILTSRAHIYIKLSTSQYSLLRTGALVSLIRLH